MLRPAARPAASGQRSGLQRARSPDAFSPGGAGQRAHADARWPVIFTTVMTTSHKAPDPGFKSHSSLGPSIGPRGLSHRYLHSHSVRQTGGHCKPHVTDGDTEARARHPPPCQQTGMANPHLELGATLPLVPPLLLCPAHSAQSPAGPRGRCPSLAEPPGSRGESARPAQLAHLGCLEIRACGSPLAR